MKEDVEQVLAVQLPWSKCTSLCGGMSGFFKTVIKDTSANMLYMVCAYVTAMHFLSSLQSFFQFQGKAAPLVAFAVSSRWENPDPNLCLCLGESSSCFLS